MFKTFDSRLSLVLSVAAIFYTAVAMCAVGPLYGGIISLSIITGIAIMIKIITWVLDGK